MSGIFNLIISPLGLPIPAIWEWCILMIVNILAFRIAWEVSPGGDFGSIIHWIVRLAVFILIWAVLYWIIVGLKFVVTNWKPFAIGGVVIVFIAIACTLINRYGSMDNDV